MIKKRQATFPFITVIPRASRPSWQAGSPDARRALAILDAVCAEYKADRARVYLTGVSTGGQGTWSLAESHPERWAAIAPIAGANFSVDTAARFKDIPCWCFHGDADTIIDVNFSRKTIAALKAAGGTPRYTEYRGVGHRCWDRAYGDPKLFAFFLAHKKK
jgi:predicted peptidase